MNGRVVLAYAKPTNFCNVGCTHCYLPEAVRADRRRMAPETVDAMGSFLKDMRDRGRYSGVFVLWHGGEPLTLAPEWYEEAGRILDRHLPVRAEGMQSSLIPLRPEHLPLVVARFGGHIGSSVDFSQRMIKGSVEEYHRLWMAKVDMARSAGIGITPGVVPTTREIGREREMVRWFVDRQFDAFNIDRYNAYASHFPDRPTNRQHSVFLTALFEALMDELERTGASPTVGAVQAALTGALFGVGGDRWGGHCQSDFVVVEPDGSLNNCPDKSTLEPAYANLADGFDGFARSKFRRKWIRHQAITHRQDHCTGCENRSWCASGCPITGNGVPDGEDECSGYKSFIDVVRLWAADPARRTLLEGYLAQGRDAGSPYSATPPETACAA